MTNFSFLEKLDKNLYDIIDEAECLYREEHFDQCIVQTRKFAENICKKTLGDNYSFEPTFDDMLATLKDHISGSIESKEFIDDLYFLKKQGNISAHSTNVKNNGINALECLQRAFEVTLNYCVYHLGTEKKLLNKQYDIDLLITGKKSKKTLSQKYLEGKKVISGNKKIKNNEKQFCVISSDKKTKNNIFGILLVILLCISAFILLTMSLIA